MKKTLLKSVLILGLMIGAYSAFGFDGLPTPTCNPNNGTCLPPSR